MKSLMFALLFIGSFARADFDPPRDCIRLLLSVLGPEYTYINKFMVSRTEKNGDLIVYNSKGVTSHLLPNGSCYPSKNGTDDYNGVMIGAYLRAKKVMSPEEQARDNKLSERTGNGIPIQGHPSSAIEACDVQEKNSAWWKVAKQSEQFERPKVKQSVE
jgi:hypothetical protein